MPDVAYLTRRLIHRLRGRVVHVRPPEKPRGNVLISYTTLPYLDLRPEVLAAHTNRWECMQIARTFLEHGYAVDVIDSTDSRFTPKKKYTYFVDVGTNMDRVAPLLNPDCIKIFHITHAHWQFQNNAELACIDEIKKKRGVAVRPDRVMAPSHAIELCDVATAIAGNFALQTYAYAGKEIVRIPLSTTHAFPSPEHRDFDSIRRNFAWFGGGGLALKRLDLVLEAFAQMPEYQLAVCGKISPQDPFVQAYEKELYHTKNIKTYGWTDPGSDLFKSLSEGSIGIVYPSASEGCAGSVVLCMHAGLVPIVSTETGVTVSGFGVLLKEKTVEAICRAVRDLSSLPADTLKAAAVAAWEYARAHHTQETFAAAYKAFVADLEKKDGKKYE